MQASNVGLRVVNSHRKGLDWGLYELSRRLKKGTRGWGWGYGGPDGGLKKELRPRRVNGSEGRGDEELQTISHWYPLDVKRKGSQSHHIVQPY